MKSADLSDRPGRAAPPRRPGFGAVFLLRGFWAGFFRRFFFEERGGAGWCGPGQVSAGPVQKITLNRSQIPSAREERTRFYSLMLFISARKNKSAGQKAARADNCFLQPAFRLLRGTRATGDSLKPGVLIMQRAKFCPLFSFEPNPDSFEGILRCAGRQASGPSQANRYWHFCGLPGTGHTSPAYSLNL